MRASGLVIALVLAGSVAASQGHAQAVATAPAAPPSPDAVAYGAAVATSDPASRAAALESFLQQNAGSIYKAKALEAEMTAYQELNDAVHAEYAAQRLLQADPASVPALALIVYLEQSRGTAMAEGPARTALLKQAADHANKGLAGVDKWSGPDGTAAENLLAVRNKVRGVFYGALGFDRLAAKDYAIARYYYLMASQSDPNDLQIAYQYALADLRAKPVDPEGFWWAARTYALAGAANAFDTQTAIDGMGRESYRHFHGSEDGWDSLLAEAALQSAPPQGFKVAPAPSDAQLAVQAVQQGDPAQLTFSDWEFVLGQRDASPANQAAADRVWAAIMAKQDGGSTRLKLPMKVISATRTTLDGAVSDDSRQSGRADLHVVLAIRPAQPPAPGTEVTVLGVIDGYAPNPVRFTMEKAEIETQ